MLVNSTSYFFLYVGPTETDSFKNNPIFKDLHYSEKQTRSRGYKPTPCPTQLCTKFFLLINVMGKKSSILRLPEPKKSWISEYYYSYEHLSPMLSLAEHGNRSTTSDPDIPKLQK